MKDFQKKLKGVYNWTTKNWKALANSRWCFGWT